MRAAEMALNVEPQILPVVPTIPEAILCCDSATWVKANRLTTRYETSAPITPITPRLAIACRATDTHRRE